MYRLAIVFFLAYLTVSNGRSSVAREIGGSSSAGVSGRTIGSNCPERNSSISVKIFRNPKGDWLTTLSSRNKLRNIFLSEDIELENNVIQCGDSIYVKLTGLLNDRVRDNSSGVRSVDDRYKGNEEQCEWIPRICSMADDFVSVKDAQSAKSDETIESIRLLERRMNALEKQMNDTAKEVSKGLEKGFREGADGILTELRIFLKEYANISTTNATTKTATLPNSTGDTEGHKFDPVYKGWKVELSSDLKTATRTRPLENQERYAAVLSLSPLREGKLFEFVVEGTAGQSDFEYGIPIGVLINKKEEVKRNGYIFNSIPGSWCIKSWSGSKPGKSDKYIDGKEYHNDGYSLDTRQLTVGTKVGIARLSNGDIRFFLDGEDKGTAFRNVPEDVYAFVEISEYLTRIRITDD